MVPISIPNNYTTSPSSFVGTPALTINHVATLGLDSTNAFEGPEKLLEVWFSASPEDLSGTSVPEGLKAVPSEVWKSMLDLVNCQVLSIVESDDVDAYLLSESSMFVFAHKLILKTCGTTTLLHGLPRILEIAALYAGFPKCSPPMVGGISTAAAPYRVFYSRKNFLFPERQRGPHRSWRDEVRAMDKLFQGGSAYMIGKMNGEHWYLYLTEPFTELTPPSSPTHDTKIKTMSFPDPVDHRSLGRSGCDENDETLEILMTDLDEENAKQFYLNHASAVAEDRHRCRDNDESGDSFDVFSNNSSDNSDVGSDGGNSLPSELSSEGHALGTVVSESCGLANLYPPSKYPDSRIDAYLFSPCGFSANGVVPAPDGKSGTHYFTVHVTPEPHCSYASFETNVPHSQSGRETADIVLHAVDIFKPARFSVTLFEAKVAAYPATAKGATNGDEIDYLTEVGRLQRQTALRNTKMDHIPGYRRVDRIVHDLDGLPMPNQKKRLSVASGASSSTQASKRPRTHPLRQTSFPTSADHDPRVYSGAVSTRSDVEAGSITGSFTGSFAESFEGGSTTGGARGRKRKYKKDKDAEGSVKGSRASRRRKDGTAQSVKGDAAAAGEEEVVDDEEFEDAEVEEVGDNEAPIDADAEKKNLAILMDALSPEQSARYDFFKRAKLNKPTLRRIVNHTLSQSVPPNVVTTIGGYTKVFIGEIIEKARTVQQEWADAMDLSALAEYEAKETERLIKQQEKLDALAPQSIEQTPTQPSQSQTQPPPIVPSPESSEKEPPQENGLAVADQPTSQGVSPLSTLGPTTPTLSPGLADKNGVVEEEQKPFKFPPNPHRGPLLPSHIREALRRYKLSAEGGNVGFSGLSLNGYGVKGPFAWSTKGVGGRRLFH
ncbi:spermidine resistance protein [Myotisia sp. PD_48]|nr:spermidine resistance protein [Myotisia sp. PD_48]